MILKQRVTAQSGQFGQNTGHTSYRNTKLWKKIPSSTLALGIVEQNFKLSTMTIDTKMGDRIYIYSDGITEATNNDGLAFKQKRLEVLIGKLLTSQVDLDFLHQAEQNFRGDSHQFDDITVLEFTC